MRLLVLGGTAWLGRTVAATARDAGHDVVCAARGGSGSPPAGVDLVRVDRDAEGGLDAVVGDRAGERWDAVVDVSRQPGQVRRAARALEGAGHYVLVSSGNVYADHDTPGQDESAPVRAPLTTDVMESMETYGEAKVACEDAVREVFGDRCLVARAGLIGGPGDWSGRTSYFPERMARPVTDDGGVLVPDLPAQPTSVIDVRDLATWLVLTAGERIAGTYDACGPVVPLGEHLQACRDVAGSRAELRAAAPDWLVRHDVQPWAGPRSLPLWLPEGYAGFTARRGVRARADGLSPRPLEETLADTLAWATHDPPVDPMAGLTPDNERALLEDLVG